MPDIQRYLPNWKADAFLVLSIFVLLLNFGSQALSMPLQACLVLWAIFKCDIKLIPAVYVLLLDKANFSVFEADLLKYRVGIALSVPNVFLLGLFVLIVVAFFRGRIDGKSRMFFLPWLAASIPAAVIGWMARRNGLAMAWQSSFVDWMIPSIYFWGCLVGRSWWSGRDYFIKRMLLVSGVLAFLRLMRCFSLAPAFAPDVVTVCLGLAALNSRMTLKWKIIGLISGVGAMCSMLFLRYLARQGEGLYADESDLGSTFTQLAVMIIGVGVAFAIGKLMNRHTLKSFPWLALAFTSLVFFYSIGRANTTNASDVVTARQYNSFLERFEGKLVGDRGAVWLNAIQNEVFIRPLVFKDLRKLYVAKMNYKTGMMEDGMLMPPHNQVLTLLWRDGVWFGTTMILFLWWICLRAFSSSAKIFEDRISLIVLLAPFAGQFFAVGLTGQTVFTQTFCGNSIGSLFFPGVLYGAALWQNGLPIGRR